MMMLMLSVVVVTCSALDVPISRRGVLGTMLTAATPATMDVSPDPSLKSVARGVVLKNGLRYVDNQVGGGPEPSWGDVLQIGYTQYVRKEDATMEKIDEQKKFLVRHGNGRTIRGLDEGLHTMRIGGTRRIEVPPDLGYTIVGLGPYPEGPRKVRRFSKALDSMGADGAVVFDVTLLSKWKDPADQGFYTDASFSEKQLTLIVGKAQQAIDAIQ